MIDEINKIKIPSDNDTKDQELPINKIQIANTVPNPDSNQTHFQVKSPKKNMKISKKLLLLPIFLIFLFIFLIFTVVLPVRKTYSSFLVAYREAREAYTAAKNQDIIKALEKIKITKEKLSQTKKNLRILSWTKIIPFFGSYYSDSEHMVNASMYGLEAAEILSESIVPYADLLGFKGQGSFVSGSAEERIKKAVQTMDKITPRLKDIDEKMVLIQREIKDINPNRYNFKVKGIDVKTQLIKFKELVNQGTLALSEARPVFELLPRLLGEPKPVKYLVIFQNDKELRSTGGFMTAYAIFRLEHGIVHVEKSEDIYKLDETIGNKQKAPEPIMKYLQLRDQVWHLRDTNISPDFYQSMKNFEAIYQKGNETKDYLGIIAVDTQFLVKIMDVLGGVEAYGAKFTTEKVIACNCPQVVYELEKFADQPVNYERGSRKDLIGVLLYKMMEKALSSSPKLYWGKLFQVGLDALIEKHVLVYLKNEKAQKGIEALGYGGRIKEVENDYLHVNDTNFGGAKANMFVTHFIDQKINLEDNGEITTTITIDYKNPYPPSDCNLEHGQLCLNAPLRNWFRIYVPLGSQLLESKGSEVKITKYEELGKTVFDGFLQVRPMGSARLTLKYKLPFKLSEKEDYKLLIQKQPGTEGHEYIVTVGGKKEKFKLTTDKELKFKL